MTESRAGGREINVGNRPQTQSCVADIRHRICVRAFRRRRAGHQRDHVPAAAVSTLERAIPPAAASSAPCSSRSARTWKRCACSASSPIASKAPHRLREPGRLIVANHPTLLDVVLLVSQMPAVDCIVKRGLWRNPFLRWPVAWAGYLPNSEGEALIEECSATLRRGHSLLVFPEGTRTVPGKPLHMQRGAAHIALAAGCDILPVTIACDPPTLFKGNPWYRVPSRRFHLHVVVGDADRRARFRPRRRSPGAHRAPPHGVDAHAIRCRPNRSRGRCRRFIR